MEKISIAVLQNETGILFDDVLLCKIMSLILLESKYLVIFEMRIFRDVLNARGGVGWESALSEVLHVFRILHLQRHLFFTSSYFLLNKMGNICIIWFARNHFLEAEICVSFARGSGRRITDGLNRNFSPYSSQFIFLNIIFVLISCLSLYSPRGLGVFNLMEKITVIPNFMIVFLGVMAEDHLDLNTEFTGTRHVVCLFLQSSRGSNILSFINYLIALHSSLLVLFSSRLYLQTLSGAGQGTTKVKRALAVARGEGFATADPSGFCYHILFQDLNCFL